MPAQTFLVDDVQTCDICIVNKKTKRLEKIRIESYAQQLNERS